MYVDSKQFTPFNKNINLNLNVNNYPMATISELGAQPSMSSTVGRFYNFLIESLLLIAVVQ